MDEGRAGLPPIDLRERGGPVDGEPQLADRRLYVQLRVFRARRPGDGVGPDATMAAARAAVDTLPCTAVVYEDVHDPAGLGIVVASEDPAVLAGPARTVLAGAPFGDMLFDGRMAMLGRTYGLGHEPDLLDALVRRPLRHLQNANWPWAVWYPLRRTGAFARLEEAERRAVLREHSAIGMAFGRADLVHDIRLACYGLDPADNDFVIGLLGADLHPLSAVVEAMRPTRQTAEFIERLGPFFVGRVAHRHAGAGS
jgi:hypothetical protein